MAIDITTEKLITPAEYTRMRPPGRNGRRMSISTAYRHMLDGVNGEKLEHVRWGGDIYTSVEAVQRFVERLSTKTAPSVPRTAKQITRASERAVAELEAAGI